MWIPEFEHRESLTRARLLQQYLTIHKGLDVFRELKPQPEQTPQDAIIEQVAAYFPSNEGLRRTRSCPAQDMSMTEVSIVLRDESGRVLNPENRADLLWFQKKPASIFAVSSSNPNIVCEMSI